MSGEYFVEIWSLGLEIKTNTYTQATKILSKWGGAIKTWHPVSGKLWYMYSKTGD